MFASESSSAISLAMIFIFTNELLWATRISLEDGQSSYNNGAPYLLVQAQQQIRSEYVVPSSQYGDLASQTEKYNNLMANIGK